jgi:hypothetical protein
MAPTCVARRRTITRRRILPSVLTVESAVLAAGATADPPSVPAG